MHAHDWVVRASGSEGGEDVGGMGGEIVDQVQDLVTEGHVEVPPARRDAVADLEPQWPRTGETSGIGDGRRCRVVTTALADPPLVVGQP